MNVTTYVHGHVVYVEACPGCSGVTHRSHLMFTKCCGEALLFNTFPPQPVTMVMATKLITVLPSTKNSNTHCPGCVKRYCC